MKTRKFPSTSRRMALRTAPTHPVAPQVSDEILEEILKAAGLEALD